MEEVETEIRREMPPWGSQVDTHQRFLDRDPASRMKIYIDAGLSEQRGHLPRHPFPLQGQGKDPGMTKEAGQEAPPRLQPLRHLQRWGWTKPPASPRAYGLQGRSGRSRWRRRRRHPSRFGRRGSPTSLP